MVKGWAILKGRSSLFQEPVPGEEVVVEATKVHPKFVEAKIKNIRKESEFHVAPLCPVFEECGGCHFQHLNYINS